MRLSEAKAIAAEPEKHPAWLRIAHLMLGNAALRAFPSSPKQKELVALRQRIEAMPRELWFYAPEGV